jgi:hypothetical protein
MRSHHYEKLKKMNSKKEKSKKDSKKAQDKLLGRGGTSKSEGTPQLHGTGDDKSLDAYVAALIAEESAQAEKRYQNEGLDAYLRPPKRFFLV